MRRELGWCFAWLVLFAGTARADWTVCLSTDDRHRKGEQLLCSAIRERDPGAVGRCVRGGYEELREFRHLEDAQGFLRSACWGVAIDGFLPARKRERVRGPGW